MVGDVRVDRPYVFLGHRDVLREAAVAVDADDVDLLADVALAGAARLAVPAADVALGADALPRLASVHRVAAFHNAADELMAGGDADRDTVLAPGVPLVDVPVGPTDPGVGDGDEHVARADRWHRRVRRPRQPGRGPGLLDGRHRLGQLCFVGGRGSHHHGFVSPV